MGLYGDACATFHTCQISAYFKKKDVNICIILRHCRKSCNFVDEMKIIGFAYIDGRVEMVLKGDSALLNNRKPMFVPDWTNDLRMCPCKVLRVSRLGKNIAPRFASRYYDAIAPAVDFVAYDVLTETRKQGGSWAVANSFDYSLSVGSFASPETVYTWGLEHTDGTQTSLDSGAWCMEADEAVRRASEVMTIRQGDLIYISGTSCYVSACQNEIVRACNGGEDKLYCKIK